MMAFWILGKPCFFCKQCFFCWLSGRKHKPTNIRKWLIYTLQVCVLSTLSSDVENNLGLFVQMKIWASTAVIFLVWLISPWGILKGSGIHRELPCSKKGFRIGKSRLIPLATRSLHEFCFCEKSHWICCLEDSCQTHIPDLECGKYAGKATCKYTVYIYIHSLLYIYITYMYIM